jgi:hypothetical protein
MALPKDMPTRDPNRPYDAHARTYNPERGGYYRVPDKTPPKTPAKG